MIRLFTISLLLALCACADQQTELVDASRALRFGVESIEDTKGSIINTSNITSMSVFCAHTGTEQYSSTATSNWMHNAAVTRTTENPKWTVQGEGVNKQWKDEGYHSFFAFAPHAPEGAVVSSSEKQGPPTLTYTVPVDYTKQVDLLYSHTTLINGKQMYIGSRPVVFGFRHALSKITFDAKKEDVISEKVQILKIELTSIVNKAQYEFTMNDGHTNVEGINRKLESTEISNFSITPNQAINTTETLLLPEDQALFMINQSFTENNKLIVTYTKGNETGRTITVDLSTVTPGGWDMSKAYRYSILVKEDRVTVTAQITDWADQAVDVAVPGTFLNIFPLSLSLPQGTAGDIYYSTDGNPVTGTCDKNITLVHDINAKKFIFPSTPAVGNYIATITAGKLSRKVQVTVVEPVELPYIKIGDLLWATGNLVADGPNKCKIGKPQDGGLYFQWGSLIGWTGGANGDGTGMPTDSTAEIKVKPTGYTASPTWLECPRGSMTVSASAGNGDPCVYYLGDGWRMPNPDEWGNGFQSTPKPSGCVSGKYMSENHLTETPCVWFENAGDRFYADGRLIYSSTGWTAYYWTNQVYTNNRWRMSATATYQDFQPVLNFGYPIRCVKPAPQK